ncbi:YraN family protein [Nocardioides sp. Bht2]|uniref:YraN family protein n=1 Tax=Nocardioides sp. Bht2 TaxID=3392297 RepID=UPI0039B6AEAB
MARRSSATKALGAYGEALAARHLVAAGMVLLDHNWSCELGELDLILRDGDVLVFCEVKTRRSTSHGSPLEAVHAQKAARMRRLAARWIAAHDVHAADVRLDLVGVLAPYRGAAQIEHVAGVG